MDPVTIHVEKGSPAWKAGLRDGMRLQTVNGEPVLDFIDFEFFSSLTDLECRIEGMPSPFRIRKRAATRLGIELEKELYPPEKRCRNHCVFCFEDQLPEGMRDSLHAKDDDWRYSLLFGNYVTMTNMSEADFRRLIARKVSPINVSVHATDPEVRVRMMKNPRAAEIMSQLRRLRDGGIAFHAQIVLCPSINGGEVLSRSLHDLWSLYPAARSVAVVPLGLTRYRDGLEPLAPVSREDARTAIREIEAFSAWTSREYGFRFAFASDEMYQIAGLPWPRYEQGGHQPQIANGVGLFHDLLSDFEAALEECPETLPRKRRITLATGVSAAGTLAGMMGRLEKHTRDFSCRVVCVPNRFFGDSITVAGLLTGSDFLRQLRGGDLGEALLIPRSALKAQEPVFLDDMTLEDLSRALEVPVIPVPDDGFALVSLALGLEDVL